MLAYVIAGAKTFQEVGMEPMTLKGGFIRGCIFSLYTEKLMCIEHTGEALICDFKTRYVPLFPRRQHRWPIIGARKQR